MHMAEVQPGVPLQKCTTEAWQHSRARPLETATSKFDRGVRRQRLIPRDPVSTRHPCRGLGVRARSETGHQVARPPLHPAKNALKLWTFMSENV